MIYEWLCCAILLCYLFLGLLLISNRPSVRKNATPFEPFVSIIIAARNDGAFLKTCIESLLQMDYPRHKTELIIVDDNSDDDTRSIVESFHRSEIIKYFKLHPEIKCRPGKAGALLFGIKKSAGEIILITDADCKIPNTWVKGVLSYMTDEVGLVGGFTVLSFEGSKSIVDKIESLDLIYLLTTAAASAQMGKAASWIGNNMAFRRQVYDHVGGYQRLGFSLIEDMAMVNAVSRQTDWRIRFIADPDILIYSRPVKSLVKLVNQRRRWLSGMKDIRPFARVLLFMNFLSRIGLLLSLFVLNWKFMLVYLATIVTMDILICRISLKSLNLLNLLKYIFGFELMSLFFVLALPLSFVAKQKIIWKDHRYSYPYGKEKTVVSEHN